MTMAGHFHISGQNNDFVYYKPQLTCLFEHHKSHQTLHWSAGSPSPPPAGASPCTCVCLRHCSAGSNGHFLLPVFLPLCWCQRKAFLEQSLPGPELVFPVDPYSARVCWPLRQRVKLISLLSFLPEGRERRQFSFGRGSQWQKGTDKWNAFHSACFPHLPQLSLSISWNTPNKQFQLVFIYVSFLKSLKTKPKLSACLLTLTI